MVVLIQIIGFTLAHYWRSRLLETEEDDPMGVSFSTIFMLSFGDFGLYYENMTFIDAVIFFAATFLLTVVMMNLLIGILSEKLA